ncbi:sugar-binding domain-containing protein [Maribellus sediminis]|uniref:sugar-binding domain-containing protein n=1 Tax=Maribellus sediminis TaxID=2696285 RepID=UPI001432213D|nr:sugar-binding domain-containing protein [Maribellus sediminis]
MVSFVLNCTVKYNGDSHKQLFDLNWKFSQVNSYSASKVEYNDKNWRTLDLPHDCSKDNMLLLPDVDLNNDSLSSVFVWYRKHFEIPGNWLDKNIIIVFDGICDQNELYINGIKVENLRVDNNPIHTNLTPFINFEGMNVIAIRVAIPKKEDLHWQNPTGIFKHVWLEVKDVPVGKSRSLFKNN